MLHGMKSLSDLPLIYFRIGSRDLGAKYRPECSAKGAPDDYVTDWAADSDCWPGPRDSSEQ
jgi:hypothetical protein